jgi:hypothetical protein
MSVSAMRGARSSRLIRHEVEGAEDKGLMKTTENRVLPMSQAKKNYAEPSMKEGCPPAWAELHEAHLRRPTRRACRGFVKRRRRVPRNF